MKTITKKKYRLKLKKHGQKFRGRANNY